MPFRTARAALAPHREGIVAALGCVVRAHVRIETHGIAPDGEVPLFVNNRDAIRLQAATPLMLSVAQRLRLVQHEGL